MRNLLNARITVVSLTVVVCKTNVKSIAEKMLIWLLSSSDPTMNKAETILPRWFLPASINVLCCGLRPHGVETPI